MKVVKVILAVLLMGFCAREAQALEPKTHTFYLGPEISYIQYKEDGVDETGLMYGLNGAYTYRGPFFTEKFKKSMLKLEGHLGYGEIDYDGHLTDGSPKQINHVENSMLEVRGLAGYDFPVLSSTVITPYFGLGYRYLKDDLSKDFAGYRRESIYFYSPVGLETNTKFKKNWSFGLRFEYDLFWTGEQKSYLSDVNVSLADISNDQDGGWGMKASVKLKHEQELMNVIIEPYVNYWDMDAPKSTPLVLFGAIVGSTVDQAYTSLECGLKLGIEY